MISKKGLLISLTALILVGCGNDAEYKRQINGDDDYVRTAQLRPLNVPEGSQVPKEKGTFYIFKANTQGATGKNLDIRPPLLPKLTSVGNSAYYQNDEMVMFTYDSNDWTKIQWALSQLSVPFKASSSSAIVTSPVLLDKDAKVYGTYQISQPAIGQITFKLTQLKQGNKNLSEAADVKRYTIEFFNLVMDKLDTSASQQDEGSYAE